MPLTMGAFVIAGLGLIGVPGTAGFVSKWFLIQGAAEAGQWWLVGRHRHLVGAGRRLCRPGRRGGLVPRARRRASCASRRSRCWSVTWILAAAVIYFGLQTDLTAGVAAQAARELLTGVVPAGVAHGG